MGRRCDGNVRATPERRAGGLGSGEGSGPPCENSLCKAWIRALVSQCQPSPASNRTPQGGRSAVLSLYSLSSPKNSFQGVEEGRPGACRAVCGGPRGSGQRAGTGRLTQVAGGAAPVGSPETQTRRKGSTAVRNAQPQGWVLPALPPLGGRCAPRGQGLPEARGTGLCFRGAFL